MDKLSKFLNFLKEEKSWWLTVILILLLILAAFIIFTEGFILSPFIYSRF